MTTEPNVGKTKDAGWQVGARRTFRVNQPKAWDFMVSGRGLKLWLGTDVGDLKVGESHRLADGTQIRITVSKPYSHIRMNWQKKNWKNHSRLQLRVMESGERSVIAFHQEMLENKEQRAEMKQHWKGILERLEGPLADLS